MKNTNPMLLIDFYKAVHAEMLPRNITKSVSYFTPRMSRVERWNEVVMFGLQGFIKKYLIDYFNTEFFHRPFSEVIGEYARIMDATLGANAYSITKIERLHRLGYLPIEIVALPEGTLVPMHVPMFGITNTHPDFAWLPQSLESLISAESWHPMIAATVGYTYRQIVNEYYEQGLRIIEVYKHQFRLLSDILEQVKDRNYKFIIYMDDLSFEDSELEYKYLKAILEGGLGRRPDNVLIYATSNRRHLIRESFRDKEEADEELHRRDTVQEKISLSARFGVKIFFESPNKVMFRKIVRSLAERNGIGLPEEELFLEANKWEISHGGMSGRTAQQFITYLKGKEAEAAEAKAKP